MIQPDQEMARRDCLRGTYVSAILCGIWAYTAISLEKEAEFSPRCGFVQPNDFDKAQR